MKSRCKSSANPVSPLYDCIEAYADRKGPTIVSGTSLVPDRSGRLAGAELRQFGLGHRDRPVAAGLAVAGEIIEALVFLARLEIAVGLDQLVAPPLGQRHDLARGRDDAAMGQHLHPFLAARLAGRGDPDAVLIGGRLHADQMVEGAQLVLLRPRSEEHT